ncbi:MAG: signal peptidase I [Dehalococcoidia bacterium]|nr:signal peptidase I [Dehalococcoidia bacterium]
MKLSSRFLHNILTLANPARLLSRQFVRVNGESMTPALKHGQWAWVDKAAYRKSPPQRFDIVRFEDPSRPGRWSVKRIAGLPGERVVLDRGVLTVNGTPVSEAHLAQTRSDSVYHEWFLKDGEYVVLGDNRGASTDSRRYGPVKSAAILGRVVL